VTPAPKRPAAIVTGGASGIGGACCGALAAAGFDIACIDLAPADAAATTLAAVESAGASALYVECDIADVASHAGVVERIVQRCGPIDCLVNNAGVTSLARGDMLDLTPESFDRSVAINLRGTFFLTQAVARAMIAADATGAHSAYRSIVTITSVNAEVLGLNRADYCITKAGLSMASRLFAARLAASGIHVFEVRPGIIRTAMTAPAAAKYDRLIGDGGVPIARWGAPEDVAATVATLARGGLAFATGEVVHVDGGLHLHRV
jgi:NAD(P)-dependent dehydrogenase (short-subunit alcohol dehydrogenase family)